MHIEDWTLIEDASHALEAGKSIRWVSEVLGHANPELTLRVYAHVLRDEEQDLSFLDFEGAAERRHQTATAGNKWGGPERGRSAKRLVPKRKPGAGNGTRTRDPQLGKLMLYQLSYSRPGSEDTAGPAAKVAGPRRRFERERSGKPTAPGGSHMAPLLL